MSVRALKGWDQEFDSIAFRGMSGALIAPPVALKMNKALLMVRKPDDGSHALRYNEIKGLVEGNVASQAYIIIDDFVASGMTAYKIKEAIKNFAPQAKCLGVLRVTNITEEKLRDARGGKYPLWWL